MFGLNLLVTLNYKQKPLFNSKFWFELDAVIYVNNFSGLKVYESTANNIEVPFAKTAFAANATAKKVLIRKRRGSGKLLFISFFVVLCCVIIQFSVVFKVADLLLCVQKNPPKA